MVEENKDTIKFGFHNTLKKMYFTPKEFFRSESETSYQSLLRMFVLFYVFFVVLMQLSSVFYGEFNFWAGIVAILSGVIFSVVVAFVFPGVMYLISVLIGIKADFFKIYKAGIYTLVLWTFYSIVLLIVSLVIPFDSQGLQVALAGTQDSSEISSLGINFLKNNPGSLISLLISAIVHLHVLVFGIKALSAFQKISRSKSAIVVIGTVALVFLAQVGIVAYLVSSGNTANLTP